MNEIIDLAVIGGGAAGFFGAIQAAEHATSPHKIVIFEKTAKTLGKVKISGGGRCNVTHDCLEPKQLTKAYPRGEKSLIGPFHHFGAKETIDWFQSKGVELKTEDDGRMFPITDSSQTIIDCLESAANEHQIEVRKNTGISSIEKGEGHFTLIDSEDREIKAKRILLATGGTRLNAGAKLAEELGHELEPNVPSLFTFKIDDQRLGDISGLSVKNGKVTILKTKFENQGPVLVTHWGLSGPGILKLSSIAAKELAELDYKFKIQVDWCPGFDSARMFHLKRKEWGKRSISKRSPMMSIPKRLWEKLCYAAGIDEELTWSRLSKQEEEALLAQVHHCEFQVNGKSVNKDEFVTCGGVKLKDVSLKNMESKICPNLFFAGEVLNIDGITGGYNFQNAWTTGHLFGRTYS